MNDWTIGSTHQSINPSIQPSFHFFWPRFFFFLAKDFCEDLGPRDGALIFSESWHWGCWLSWQLEKVRSHRMWKKLKEARIQQVKNVEISQKTKGKLKQGVLSEVSLGSILFFAIYKRNNTLLQNMMISLYFSPQVVTVVNILSQSKIQKTL